MPHDSKAATPLELALWDNVRRIVGTQGSFSSALVGLTEATLGCKLERLWRSGCIVPFAKTALRHCLAALAVILASCSSLKTKPHAAPSLAPGQWTSYDGKVMPWKEWPVAKAAPPRAIIIAVHGLSGATSDFWPLGESLPKSGMAVYAFELRGQGNDPDLATRGDIRSGRQWLDDLRTFHQLVRARHPGVPILWYGESLGSLITLHAIDAPDACPDALILASPLAGIRMSISVCQRLAILATSRLLPRLSFRLGTLSGIDENKVQTTSTTTHGEQMAITPHHVPSFSLRLIRELSRLIDGNPIAAVQATMPVLVIGSPNDVVASPDQVQELFSHLAAQDKQLHWYTRSYHLLLHDVQREQVLKDVSGWTKRHLPSQ